MLGCKELKTCEPGFMVDGVKRFSKVAQSWKELQQSKWNTSSELCQELNDKHLLAWLQWLLLGLYKCWWQSFLWLHYPRWSHYTTDYWVQPINHICNSVIQMFWKEVLPTEVTISSSSVLVILTLTISFRAIMRVLIRPSRLGKIRSSLEK